MRGAAGAIGRRRAAGGAGGAGPGCRQPVLSVRRAMRVRVARGERAAGRR